DLGGMRAEDSLSSQGPWHRAEQRHERAAPNHSITSSARWRCSGVAVGGTGAATGEGCDAASKRKRLVVDAETPHSRCDHAVGTKRYPLPSRTMCPFAGNGKCIAWISILSAAARSSRRLRVSTAILRSTSEAYSHSGWRANTNGLLVESIIINSALSLE